MRLKYHNEESITNALWLPKMSSRKLWNITERSQQPRHAENVGNSRNVGKRLVQEFGCIVREVFACLFLSPSCLSVTFAAHLWSHPLGPDKTDLHIPSDRIVHKRWLPTGRSLPIQSQQRLMWGIEQVARAELAKKQRTDIMLPKLDKALLCDSLIHRQNGALLDIFIHMTSMPIIPKRCHLWWTDIQYMKLLIQHSFYTSEDHVIENKTKSLSSNQISNPSTPSLSFSLHLLLLLSMFTRRPLGVRAREIKPSFSSTTPVLRVVSRALWLVWFNVQLTVLTAFCNFLSERIVSNDSNKRVPFSWIQKYWP